MNVERHALYPGSFDPVTLGHMDIVTRAASLFDKVTVAVAHSGKAGLLGIDERVALIRDSVSGLPDVEVQPFSGLLVDEVAARGADAVIRGIRSQGDYEHEWSLAGVNALLASDIEYIYLLARPSLAAISSTLVRDVIRHGGPLEKLVPPAVIKALADRES
jgi:pantetheine-phosphate adenylyltransferase